MKLFEKKDALDVIKEKYAAYNAEVKAANEAIANAEAKIIEANTALEAAADLNDTVAFSRAKKLVADAETALEMAVMRKDRIVARGACPKEEVKAALDDYENQVYALEEEAYKELASCLSSLVASIEEKEMQADKLRGKARELCELTGRKAPDFTLLAVGEKLSGHKFLCSNVNITWALSHNGRLMKYLKK